MINFDSLYPKRDELSATLLDENLDFVLGCETHLDSNISDPEFHSKIIDCNPLFIELVLKNILGSGNQAWPCPSVLSPAAPAG